MSRHSGDSAIVRPDEMPCFRRKSGGSGENLFLGGKLFLPVLNGRGGFSLLRTAGNDGQELSSTVAQGFSLASDVSVQQHRLRKHEARTR
jgi:hypothetical protein